MKRKNKKRIVVELRILIILCFVNYYLWFWKKTPLASLGVGLGIIFALVDWGSLILTGKDIKDQVREWRKPTLPKSTSVKATIEVKDIEELEEVANKTPFMENLPTGAETKEEKTWHNVEKEIYFSNLEPIDLSADRKVFSIIGKHGAGKSTYMLWSLSRYLQKEKPWQFKKVVFLNPATPDLWASDLTEYDSDETLLVVDALYRASDSDNEILFNNRCSSLFELARESVKTTEEGEDETNVGPFKILATIRDDEYEKLLTQGEFCGVPDTYFGKFEITPDRLDFRKILERLLCSYDVRYYPEDLDEDLIKQLKTQSEGLPFYIRHLVICLKETKGRFSKDTLRKFPPGMANLIWHTIRKSYYVENDRVIPFLLLLLLKTDKHFSKHFLHFVVGKALNAGRKVRKKIEILKDKHFQSPDKNEKVFFALSSHWKISLRKGLEQPDEISNSYRKVVDSYKTIEDAEFNHSLITVTTKLQEHLREGFIDKADDFLCIDLAKLSEENLIVATDIYTKFCDSHKYSLDYKKYVQEELYKLWISSAWKYRAIPSHNPKDVIRCYEKAFDELKVRSHPKQLHAYAYYLFERILPRCNYGTPEWQECKKQIEKLYNEVIELKLDDPKSYLALALFYAEVGEEKKAEKTFGDSFKVSPEHIPTMQAYAIFLKDRGKREYNRKKALDYYERAEEQFKKAIKTLNSQKGNLSKKEFEEFEKRVLNACVSFLINKTEWVREYDERKKIDAQVDKLFEVDLLKKYPNHGHSITKYSRFLMDFAWILDKYNDWEEGERKNLRKARLLLEKFIRDEEKKPEQELSYFMSLHILALYYYRPKYHPKYDPLNKLLQRLQKAEECLKKSSTSFSNRHNSIAYNELGRLYTQWARVIRSINQCDYEKKMSSAKAAYEEAIRLAPENRQFSSHLSSVYFNYAFYFQRMDDTAQSEKCIHRALDVVKGFVPTSSYYSLTNLGTEFLRDDDLDIAERVFIEAKKLQSDRINPSYALCKLGDINGKKRNIEEALKNYLQSAQYENTSEAYGTRRHSIKQLMNHCLIRQGHAYYDKCMRGRIECSEKAYKLDPNLWKNCGDYGEDLRKAGRYREALPILKESLKLLFNDKEIEDCRKKEGLSFYYKNIGYCYKNLEYNTKAEEYFDKSAAVGDSAIAYCENVKSMFELGKYERTINAFQELVKKTPFSEEEKENIFPRMANVLNNVATSYENLSRNEEAISFWKYYADVSFYSPYSHPSESAKSCGIAGNKCLKMKKFPEARKCFLKSIRLCPDSKQNLSQLGFTNICLGRRREGKICLERGLLLGSAETDRELIKQCEQKQKDNLEVFRSTREIDDLIDLAVTQELQGQLEAALQCYEDALTLLYKQEPPDNAEAYRFIADAFWGLGKAEKSLELYKKIRDRFEDYQKIVIEAIIWFISRKMAES